MTEEKDERRARIEEAAYEVLRAKGFKGASMLAVARAAKASNETLYNWYGDKVGLFSALVERNASEVAAALAQLRAKGGRGLSALERVSPVLVKMVTGERAVALNRAAAADVTGELGRALAKGGREAIAPTLAALVGEAVAEGDLSGDVSEIIQTYLGLLLGDIQIRRAIGVLEPLDKKEATARTQRAMAQIKTLYAP